MRVEFIKKDEAIKLLSEGWEIFTDRNEHNGKNGQIIYSSLNYLISDPNNPTTKWVHPSTIAALKKDGIIQPHSPYHFIKQKTKQ